MTDETEAHSAHRLVQFSDGVFTVTLILIAAVNLAVGEYTWIAIFVVLRLLSNRYRDQVGARHRAIL